MSRSPLAYPLTRGIDGDSGGAADLQTDVMRFMAILALCLVAIFALVQSLPTSPQTGVNAPPVSTPAPAGPPARAARAESLQRAQPASGPSATPGVEAPVTLTRPGRTAARSPGAPAKERHRPVTAHATPAPPREKAAPSPTVETPATEPKGFTLRFESDLALTRLVATGQVGFFAIDRNRARRMAVRESRISFWDASVPSEFHEMEAATVPHPVIAALRRSGAEAAGVRFGVTLPSRLREQLTTIMKAHRGGALVIGEGGELSLEGSE